MQENRDVTNPMVDPKSDDGVIVFENVFFTYPLANSTAVRNVAYNIKHGERIAIVGKTGCGKSTIADLLLRIYDVTEGKILIDGNEITSLDLFNLRRQIGYVPQDGFLFSDSVANNISYGSIASQEKIRDFAQSVAIHGEIMALPEEYETTVGERGVTLSGGQKQRISIARALIKDPDIIILDDCLSAVDAGTEQKILEYLNENITQKTTIVITHRITTLLSYDKIFVMKDGAIVEQGDHEELIMLNGLYKEMFERQNIEINNL